MTSSCAGEEMAESTSSLEDKEEEISEDTVAGLRRKRPTVSYRNSAVALEILLGKALHLHEVFDYPLSKLDPCSAHSDPPVIAVYETLVNKGPDGEAHPGLAASWEVSDDKLTWAFRLRPNARFHSGDACDAEAVEAACERIRYGFHGGKEFFYWNPVDQVRADSALKLVITLHHPYPRLPSILWGPHSVIHNDRRRATDPDGSGADWADGTGPFRFVSYSPEKIEVERFEGYAGCQAAFLKTDGPANLERITWTSILDPAERVAALDLREAHCTHGPNFEDVARLEEDPELNVIRFSQASNAYLALNWQRTELGFDDVRVRKAVSLAIDRPALVRDALLGYGAPTVGPLSVDGEFYDPVVDSGQDLDLCESARLFEEAGWALDAHGVRARGDARLSFECLTQDDAVHQRVAEGLRDQLEKIGVILELRPIRSFHAFYEGCKAGPPAFLNKWLWQDPMDAIVGFIASWGRPDPNWHHSSLPVLDEAFRAWLRAETPEKLQAIASRIQMLVREHLPYIPLLVPQDVWVHAKAVKNWSPAQSILYPFYHRTVIDR